MQNATKLREQILHIVRELTGAAADTLTAETPLMEAGVDSLAATELSIRLRQITGLAFSSTLIFEHPTPRAIATHVLERLGGTRPVASPAAMAIAGAGGGRLPAGVLAGGVAGAWSARAIASPCSCSRR